MADVLHDIDAAYPAATDPSEARARALRALAREIDGAGAPPRGRRRVVVVAAGAVAVTLAGAAIVRTVLPGDGPGGLERADAATVRTLETGARAALAQPAVTAPRKGQFVYTHSQSLGMVATGGDTPTAWLTRSDRRSWVGADGSLRLVERSTPGRFLTGDRSMWERDVRRLSRMDQPSVSTTAAGGQTLAKSFADAGAGDAALAAHVDDPAAAAALLRAAAPNYGGQDVDEEMFTMVGDGLRESLFSPAARAALFRAAAYIPGVESLGDVVDANGRHGMGVARVARGERTELVFDPHTAALLAEREVVVDPATLELPVPVGTVMFDSTYLESGVVGSDTATP